MAARSKLPEITLDSDAIEAAVRDAAERIEAVLRAEIQRRVDEAVGIALEKAKTARGPVVVGGREIPRVGKSGRLKRLCPVPGCGNFAAGPKYGWRCRDHKNVSKAEIERLKLDSGAIEVKKLKPRKGPGERRTRTGPPMECRVPGCPVKSRGPRYDFFCAEHYGRFDADQRKAFVRQWKEAREKAAIDGPKAPAPVVIVRKAAAPAPEAAENVAPPSPAPAAE